MKATIGWLELLKDQSIFVNGDTRKHDTYDLEFTNLPKNITSQLCSNKDFAIDFPMPWDPPVTNAVLFDKFISNLCLYCFNHFTFDSFFHTNLSNKKSKYL